VLKNTVELLSRLLLGSYWRNQEGYITLHKMIEQIAWIYGGKRSENESK